MSGTESGVERGAMRVVTFGCRLNIHESQAIREAAGASDGLIVVNTCAVTGEAVAQARQAIRRLRREDPAARIVATGCAATIDPDAFLAMPEVDHVVGNGEKLRAPTWASVRAGGERRIAGDIMAEGATAVPRLAGFEARTRAFLQIQNGCDHRCTFCIIPFGRGRSRSVTPNEAVAQARTLTQNGYREIVLTGVDLTSYGADLPGEPRLGQLVRRILAEVPDLPRLRLSSIDSIEVDPDLMRAIGEEERLMPHLHLSLQAGDDLILKRMKRRHSRAQALAFCEEVRRLRPDIVFGADIIAGFPTESEAAFERSLSMLEEIGVTHLHAFPFSPRPGTPAARMPPVAPALVKERAARLRAHGAALLAAALQREAGQTRQVLVERGGVGRTEHFLPVSFAAPPPQGTLLPVTIAGHDGTRLTAA